jgi:uncharacterized protein (DUF302 family)
VEFSDMTYHFSTQFEGSFDEAVAAVTSALQQRGFGILTEIDVAATLKKKIDVDHPSYRILGACNPSMAYRALQSEPRIGLMLPCNVVVREIEDGSVEISAVDPVASMQAVNSPDLAGTARQVQVQLKEAIESLRQRSSS